jgi:hypothetical protein
LRIRVDVANKPDDQPRPPNVTLATWGKQPFMSSSAGDQPALYLPNARATIFAVAPMAQQKSICLPPIAAVPGKEDDISATTARWNRANATRLSIVL